MTICFFSVCHTLLFQSNERLLCLYPLWLCLSVSSALNVTQVKPCTLKMMYLIYVLYSLNIDFATVWFILVLCAVNVDLLQLFVLGWHIKFCMHAPYAFVPSIWPVGPRCLYRVHRSSDAPSKGLTWYKSLITTNCCLIMSVCLGDTM